MDALDPYIPHPRNQGSRRHDCHNQNCWHISSLLKILPVSHNSSSFQTLKCNIIPSMIFRSLSLFQAFSLKVQTCVSICLIVFSVSFLRDIGSSCTHNLLTESKNSLNGITFHSFVQDKNFKLILDSSLTLTFQINLSSWVVLSSKYSLNPNFTTYICNYH